MQLNSYLMFQGNAEEVLEHYRQALGGTVEMMRFEDTPEADTVPPGWKKKLMHGALSSPAGGIMVSDATPERWKGVTPGNNFSIAIASEDEAEADAVFSKLSAGGTVTLPFVKMFWGAKFGMLTDKFGVTWMVNCAL